MLLDWEHWGIAPRGYDVARLICLSAHDRDVSRQLQAMFSDELDTQSGDVAMLTAIAGLRLNSAMHYGDAFDDALDRMARKILSRPKWFPRRFFNSAAPLFDTRMRTQRASTLQGAE
jgi:hypothetical protein